MLPRDTRPLRPSRAPRLMTRPSARPAARRAVAVLALGALAAAALAGCTTPQPKILAASETGDLTWPLQTRAAPHAEQRALCGDGAETEVGAARIVRSPYVQDVTTERFTVLWTEAVSARVPTTGRTVRPAPVRVEVTTPEGELVATAEAHADRLAPALDAVQYAATVDGLAPDRTWCYRLRMGDAALTAPAGVRTAPAAGSGAPVRFVAFGDAGDGSEAQRAVARAMEDVPFDLMLVTGDLAAYVGTPREYEQHVFGVYRDVLRHVPLYVAAGNHDYKADAGATMRAFFALPRNGGPGADERWFSFDRGDVHFVGLDSEDLTAAQLRWLEADLAGNALPWTVVFLHRPPFSSGSHGSDPVIREKVWPILVRHGVDLVLAGHDHDYERTTPQDGVVVVVTGGGGKGTKPVGRSEFTAFSQQVLHFVFVEIEGDRLTLHAIDGTGREFDSAVIEKSGPSADRPSPDHQAP